MSPWVRLDLCPETIEQREAYDFYSDRIIRCSEAKDHLFSHYKFDSQHHWDVMHAEALNCQELLIILS